MEKIYEIFNKNFTKKLEKPDKSQNEEKMCNLKDEWSTDYGMVLQDEKLNGIRLDILDEINNEHLHTNTFINCIFEREVHISSKIIEEKAFIGCIFKNNVIINTEYKKEFFHNCIFEKGLKVINDILHNDNNLINIKDVDLNEFYIPTVENKVYEEIDLKVIQTDTIPTGSYHMKIFIHTLEIIANEICNEAFDDCIFNENIILQINTYEGNIFHNCSFKKEIIFKSHANKNNISSKVGNITQYEPHNASQKKYNNIYYNNVYSNFTTIGYK